jgi:hypothetical protein
MTADTVNSNTGGAIAHRDPMKATSRSQFGAVQRIGTSRKQRLGSISQVKTIASGAAATKPNWTKTQRKINRFKRTHRNTSRVDRNTKRTSDRKETAEQGKEHDAEPIDAERIVESYRDFRAAEHYQQQRHNAKKQSHDHHPH